MFRIREAVDLLVLGDQVLLPRRLSVRMSRRGFRSEDVLLKEALSDELLRVLPEFPALNGQVSLTFVVGAVILRSKKRRVVLERSQASDPRFIFESVKDFIDRELQPSEAFHRSIASERAWGVDRNRLLLVSGYDVGLECD